MSKDDLLDHSKIKSVKTEFEGMIGVPGMTLRYWFAGMALASGNVLQSNHVDPEVIAYDMYRIADAMMKEKE